MALTTVSSLLIPVQIEAATLRTYTGSDPAAGSEISETVPAGKTWAIQGITFAFVSDATAIARYVTLVIDDGTNIIVRSGSFATQNATTTTGYSFYANAHGLGVNIPQGPSMSLPMIWAREGWRIRTLTGNIQAGDNYGVPALSVLEYTI